MRICESPGLSVLASAVLVASLGLVVSIYKSGVIDIPVWWTQNLPLQDYGVVVDAGSHGTRAHVFEWAGRIDTPDESTRSAVTIPEEIALCDGWAGLSTFAYNPKDVGQSVLAPMIDCIENELTKKQVSKDRWAHVPVFVKATAGLRTMDIDQRDLLMSNIRSFLGNKTLSPFVTHPHWVRVISGEEEGVFGWMTVNQGLHTLQKNANATVGALDLGGASAQVTFSPLHASVMEDFYELNLGGRPVRLYSHSFLSYGWGDAGIRLTSRLALETIFNTLNRDSAITSGKTDAADEVIAGKVPGIIVRPFEPNPKTPHSGGMATPVAAGSPQFVAEIVASHPCYPKGHSYNFEIPSVIYPDGRSFIDLDLRAILEYLKVTGVSMDSPAIKKLFPMATTLDEERFDTLLFAPAVYQTANNNSTQTYHMLPDGVAVPTTAVAGTIGSEFRGFNASRDLAISEEEIIPFAPPSVPLPSGRIKYVISFQGSSDFESCQARAKDLFYQEPCFLHTCSFNGVYQPRIAESRFVAFGQFTKVQAALAIPDTATPNTLERATASVCSMSKSALDQGSDKGNFQPFKKKGLVDLCWKSVWAHTVLTRGYGFDGESKNIQFASPTLPTGWALGSMIFEISYLPWTMGRFRYKWPFFWALATTGVLIFALIDALMRLWNANIEKKHLISELIVNQQGEGVYHHLEDGHGH